jgi:hypothetical protein
VLVTAPSGHQQGCDSILLDRLKDAKPLPETDSESLLLDEDSLNFLRNFKTNQAASTQGLTFMPCSTISECNEGDPSKVKPGTPAKQPSSQKPKKVEPSVFVEEDGKIGCSEPEGQF